MAVLWSIEKLRPYIEGTHFTLLTDHWSLCWLHNLKDPTGRLARWSLKLQQYSFDVIHRKGKEHVVPNMLSRSVPVVDSIEVTDDIGVEGNDKWYSNMVFKVQNNPLRYPSWRVTNSKLYKYVKYKTMPDIEVINDWKLVIPKMQRIEIFKRYHDDPRTGHPGIFKTFKRISQYFFWPKLKSDVSKYVSKCSVCVQYKSSQQRPAGLMTPHRVFNKPFECVACDLIGPLPRSSKRFKYILVLIDNFSKFTLVMPLRNATGRLICTAVEEHLFLIFGHPKLLISDNGTQFTCNEFKNLLSSYGVRHFYTANYHPQSNPTERANKTLETMIRCYTSDNHKLWDKNLSKIACAIRTQVHESTGCSPYFIVFGREFLENALPEVDMRKI